MSRQRSTAGSDTPDRTRVLFLVEGDPRRGLSPAARYRVYAYRDHLSRQGILAEVSPSHPSKGYSQRPWHRRLSKRSKIFSRLSHLLGPILMAVWRIVDLVRSGRFDVVVLQRELLPTYPPFLELAFASRRPTIFDVDDAIHLLPPGESRLLRMTRGRRKVERILGAVEVVTVANRELERYARCHAPRVKYIPTVVDTTHYQPTAEDPGPPVVLWTGTSSNLAELERLTPVFEKVASQHAFVLRIICDRRSRIIASAKNVDLDHRPWRLETELEDLAGAAIGLMPLSDTAWNRGKSALKLLVYGSLGLPSIASPVGANKDVLIEGTTGHLVADAAGWERALVRLIGDARLRMEMGQAARENVERSWSVDTWAPVWAGLLEEVARDQG